MGDDGTFQMPVFVVTHRPREPLIKGPTTFTFVTEHAWPSGPRDTQLAEESLARSAPR